MWASNTYAQNAKTNGLPLSGMAGLKTVKGQTAYTMANGLLMAQYLILVFDVPGHMAEETKNASKAVPRSIMTTYLLGSAFNFALLLAYLYGITHIKNVTVPGFGITGSCNTNNGDLPSWSTQTLTSEGAVLPNNGLLLNKFKGGCILSNGYPFTYFPVGNIFYDAFASVRCCICVTECECCTCMTYFPTALPPVHAGAGVRAQPEQVVCARPPGRLLRHHGRRRCVWRPHWCQPRVALLSRSSI